MDGRELVLRAPRHIVIDDVGGRVGVTGHVGGAVQDVHRTGGARGLYGILETGESGERILSGLYVCYHRGRCHKRGGQPSFRDVGLETGCIDPHPVVERHGCGGHECVFALGIELISRTLRRLHLLGPVREFVEVDREPECGHILVQPDLGDGCSRTFSASERDDVPYRHVIDGKGVSAVDVEAAADGGAQILFRGKCDLLPVVAYGLAVDIVRREGPVGHTDDRLQRDIARDAAVDVSVAVLFRSSGVLGLIVQDIYDVLAGKSCQCLLEGGEESESIAVLVVCSERDIDGPEERHTVAGVIRCVPRVVHGDAAGDRTDDEGLTDGAGRILERRNDVHLCVGDHFSVGSEQYLLTLQRIQPVYLDLGIEGQRPFGVEEGMAVHAYLDLLRDHTRRDVVVHLDDAPVRAFLQCLREGVVRGPGLPSVVGEFGLGDSSAGHFEAQLGQ